MFAAPCAGSFLGQVVLGGQRFAPPCQRRFPQHRAGAVVDPRSGAGGCISRYIVCFSNASISCSVLRGWARGHSSDIGRFVACALTHHSFCVLRRSIRRIVGRAHPDPWCQRHRCICIGDKAAALPSAADISPSCFTPGG